LELKIPFTRFSLRGDLEEDQLWNEFHFIAVAAASPVISSLAVFTE
jgi:hypothetical protein